jgi:hypothetical protein
LRGWGCLSIQKYLSSDRNTALNAMWWYGTRPDIRCTFAAMRRCDATFGSGTDAATECRAGARDGHLLDYEFGKGEAYDAGRSMSMVCPPALNVGTRRHASHDPRLGYHNAVSYYPPPTAAYTPYTLQRPAYFLPYTYVHRDTRLQHQQGCATRSHCAS